MKVRPNVTRTDYQCQHGEFHALCIAYCVVVLVAQVYFTVAPFSSDLYWGDIQQLVCHVCFPSKISVACPTGKKWKTKDGIYQLKDPEPSEEDMPEMDDAIYADLLREV